MVERYLSDIRFLVRATLWTNGVGVDVEAFEVVGTVYPDGTKEGVPPEMSEDEERPLLFDDAAGGTEDITKAQRFLHGSVKWDGCSDWMFDECATHRMVHFCDPDDTTDVGRLMHALCEIAREMLGPEHWDIDRYRKPAALGAGEARCA